MGIESSAEVFTTNQEAETTERPESRSVERFTLPVETPPEYLHSLEDDEPEDKEDTLKDIVDTSADPELDADCEEKGHDHSLMSTLGWRILGSGLFIIGAALVIFPVPGGFLIAIPAWALMITGNLCFVRKKIIRLCRWSWRRITNSDKEKKEKTAN